MLVTLSIISSGLIINNPTKPNVNFDYNSFVSKTTPGVGPPFKGVFDPFNFAGTKKSNNYRKYLREAEIQHSRIAMLTMSTLPFIDFNSNELAINYISNMPVMNQVSLLIFFSIIEYYRMLTNYENPFKYGGTTFTIKEDKYPGNYLFTDVEELDKSILDKELNNGRLAMLAAVYYISKEFITQTPIF